MSRLQWPGPPLRADLANFPREKRTRAVRFAGPCESHGTSRLFPHEIGLMRRPTADLAAGAWTFCTPTACGHISPGQRPGKSAAPSQPAPQGREQGPQCPGEHSSMPPESCGKSDLRPFRAPECSEGAGFPRVLPWADMLRAFSADSVDSLGATPMFPNCIGQIRSPRASLANENPPEHSGRARSCPGGVLAQDVTVQPMEQLHSRPSYAKSLGMSATQSIGLEAQTWLWMS